MSLSAPVLLLPNTSGQPTDDPLVVMADDADLADVVRAAARPPVERPTAPTPRSRDDRPAYNLD